MKEAWNLVQNRFDPVATFLLGGLILALLLLQWKVPLRRQLFTFRKRAKTNILVALPAFGLLRLVFIPVMVWLAVLNRDQWHFGLHYLYDLPNRAEGMIGFLALDWAVYVWHFLTHRVPFLWRFHLVHHTDLDLDITTAFRFHFGELLLSVLFRGASVIFIGASPLLVVVYEIVFEACNNFHHSNWKIPLPAERVLNAVIVTPRMHGIHHSNNPDERDSNWGTVFSFWDRLHRTFSRLGAAQRIKIGEALYQNPDELTAGKLLRMPFKKQKKKS